jgi:Glutathione S-transferase, N-terminal domain
VRDQGLAGRNERERGSQMSESAPINVNTKRLRKEGAQTETGLVLSTIMITLYDIPTTQQELWSPNTWKTRYSLNYKKLPFRTEWVEYPDIASLYKKNGIPLVKTRQGKSVTTLPLIKDDTSGTPVFVAESFEIAKYLDKTYPDPTSRLVPEEANAAEKQAALPDEVFGTVLGPHLLGDPAQGYEEPAVEQGQSPTLCGSEGEGFVGSLWWNHIHR